MNGKKSACCVTPPNPVMEGFRSLWSMKSLDSLMTEHYLTMAPFFAFQTINWGGTVINVEAWVVILSSPGKFSKGTIFHSWLIWKSITHILVRLPDDGDISPAPTNLSNKAWCCSTVVKVRVASVKRFQFLSLFSITGNIILGAVGEERQEKVIKEWMKEPLVDLNWF